MTGDRSRIHDEHRLDRLLRHFIAGLLVFMPLTLGAVEAWSQAIVVLWVALIAACLAIKLTCTRDSWVFNRIYVPVFLFIALTAFQLLPLPGAIVNLISPHTYALKHANETWMTLSLYPHATQESLREVICAAILFLASIHVFRRSPQIKWLLLIITAIGAAAACLALAQDLSGTHSIYWLIPRPTDQLASGGPFVNYNNYCQFANLSLGAALGLLLALLSEWYKREDWELKRALRHLNRPELLMARRVVLAIVLMAVSVFFSHSRGGMISLLVALFITGAAMSMSRHMVGRGWVLGVVGIAVFVALLAGGLDSVMDRLGTLQHAREAGKARIEVTSDVLTQLTPRFPVLGVGLGAHEMVYPMVSRQTFVGSAGHVENEYVQLVEELGFAGVVIAAVFVALIAIALITALRQNQRPVRTSVFGLAFSLVAVLVHSFSDFGQRVPAVACLTAVLCGLIVSIARGKAPTASAAPNAERSRLRTDLLLGGFATMLILGWAVSGAFRSAMAEWRWDQTTQLEGDLARKNWRGSDEEFARLLISADSASNWDPDNILYRHWLNVYRWQSLSHPQDDGSEAVLDAQDLTFAQRIADDELQATRLCPTFGPAYCVAGQIELFALNQATLGAQHIQQGYELARSHPQTCFVAGLSDALAGRWDQSLEKMKRAVLLGHPMDAVLDVYLRQFPKPELAMQIAAGNMQALVKIAEVLEQSGGSMELAASARKQAEKILTAEAGKENAASWLLAEMAALEARQKDYQSAVEFYRRALTRDYSRADWHLALAHVLANAGQSREAIHEARVCLRLRPTMEEAQKLIADLTGKPGSAAAR